MKDAWNNRQVDAFNSHREGLAGEKPKIECYWNHCYDDKPKISGNLKLNFYCAIVAIKVEPRFKFKSSLNLRMIFFI